MLGNKARRTWHIALGPTDIPHTRRTPAAPARAPPRPGERGVTVWDGNRTSMLSPGSTTQSKGLGWSGPQVRLTRLELTIYRTEHFRPLAPNPSTPPRAASRDLGPRDLGRSRAAPRDLGRSRAISRNLGAPRHATPPHPTSPTAAPRCLGRSRSVARAARAHFALREGVEDVECRAL